MKYFKATLKRTFFLLLFFSPMARAAAESARVHLSESEAVRLAETFVRENGYTWWPASRKKYTREPFQCPMASDEQVLENRHNTVKRKAYGLLRRQLNGAPGWTIVFQRKGEGSVGGKVVGMNPDGSGIQMENTDIRLTTVEKKL